MFYENELRFLTEILKKCRVKVTLCSPDDNVEKLLDENLLMILSDRQRKHLQIKDHFVEREPYIIYRYTSQLYFSYYYLNLPQTESETILFIGPFLTSKVDSRQLLELGEKHGVSPINQKQLKEYYNSLTVINDTYEIMIMNMLDTFAEAIWGSIGTYTVVDPHDDIILQVNPLGKNGSDDNKDVLVNMKLMEQRYAYENDLMLAVSTGNARRAANIISSISGYNFEKRTPDTLRNLKNYCIVMNTLLRKAAESGGVHPLYIDDLSSRYAVKTEQLNSIDLVENLMTDMFMSYCRLVKKHSTKPYSSIVQKTIAIIDYDPSANLTLSALASSQNISAGYLSAVFKKETGKTLTDYVLDKRMALAVRLLNTSKLQIQTVAVHCGIMDVQYFSKLFKKKTGKTPKEYRESIK